MTDQVFPPKDYYITGKVYYTGIGSRSTPNQVQTQMINIASALAAKGYTLRSGGASGADTAFYRGCILGKGDKEIYLPWGGFNGSISTLYPPSEEAYEIAKAIHPAWIHLTDGGRALHARNIHQVLGKDLNSPSEFVICWTPDGKEKGGTRTAIVLAKQRNIRVYNLAVEEFQYL